jgi:hypothetical protein
MLKIVWIVLALALGGCPTFAYATCVNVAGNPTVEVVGTLDYEIFAGPPEYSDINRGDTPEVALILNLSTPLCAIGDGFLDGRLVNKIHLINTIRYDIGKIRGVNVKVSIDEIYGSHTGHHHAPVLATIVSIQRLRDNYTLNSRDIRVENRRIQNNTEDIWLEYGTPETIVRGFYDALYHGRGDLAQQFLVSEKRNVGAYSIAGMNRFYRALSRPIFLQSITTLAPRSYWVRYNYVNSGSECHGSAIVATRHKLGRNYISSIRALNGC